MNTTLRAIISWAIVLWTCYVFLASLPYKFTKHPDTQHIFGTIGQWMSSTIAQPLGELFSRFGSYVVGSFELFASLILLMPAFIWLLRRMSGRSSRDPETLNYRAKWHAIGGLLASAVMAGAVFFHLFTPLGIEVLHEGQSDGGSLFYAASSILVLGLVLFFINAGAAKTGVARNAEHMRQPRE